MFGRLNLCFLVAQAASAADKADEAKADYREKLESLDKATANAARVLQLQPRDMSKIVLSQQLVQLCQTHVDAALEAYKDAKDTARVLVQQANDATPQKVLGRGCLEWRLKKALLRMAHELALSRDKRKADIWKYIVDRYYVESHAGKDLQEAFYGDWYNETRLLSALEGNHQPALKQHVEPRHDDAKLVRVLHERTIHAVVSDMHKHMPAIQGSVEETEFNKKKSRFIDTLRSVFGSWDRVERAYVQCMKITKKWVERDDATIGKHEQLEAEAHDAWGHQWFMHACEPQGFLGPLHVPNQRAHMAVMGQRHKSTLRTAMNEAPCDEDDLLPRWQLNAMGRALAAPTVLSYSFVFY